MFKISPSPLKGFQITFDNGYTVSVQFSNGNYCSNSHIPEGFESLATCENAEVALIHPDGWLVDLSEKFGWWIGNDTVNGYTTPDEVAELIAYATSLPKK